MFRRALLTGVGTKIDPTLCRADRMVGQVLGAVGSLPDIFHELTISYTLLRRLLGVRTETDKKAFKVRPGLSLTYIWETHNFPILKLTKKHTYKNCLNELYTNACIAMPYSSHSCRLGLES